MRTSSGSSRGGGNLPGICINDPYCVWDAGEGKCHFSGSPGGCGQHADLPSCIGDPDCAWHTSNSTCTRRCSTEACCGTFGSGACGDDANCAWDSGQGRCRLDAPSVCGFTQYASCSGLAAECPCEHDGRCDWSAASSSCAPLSNASSMGYAWRFASVCETIDPCVNLTAHVSTVDLPRYGRYTAKWRAEHDGTYDEGELNPFFLMGRHFFIWTSNAVRDWYQPGETVAGGFDITQYVDPSSVDEGVAYLCEQDDADLCHRRSVATASCARNKNGYHFGCDLALPSNLTVGDYIIAWVARRSTVEAGTEYALAAKLLHVVANSTLNRTLVGWSNTGQDIYRETETFSAGFTPRTGTGVGQLINYTMLVCGNAEDDTLSSCRASPLRNGACSPGGPCGRAVCCTVPLSGLDAAYNAQLVVTAPNGTAAETGIAAKRFYVLPSPRRPWETETPVTIIQSSVDSATATPGQALNAYMDFNGTATRNRDRVHGAWLCDRSRQVFDCPATALAVGACTQPYSILPWTWSQGEGNRSRVRCSVPVPEDAFGEYLLVLKVEVDGRTDWDAKLVRVPLRVLGADAPAEPVDVAAGGEAAVTYVLSARPADVGLQFRLCTPSQALDPELCLAAGRAGSCVRTDAGAGTWDGPATYRCAASTSGLDPTSYERMYAYLLAARGTEEADDARTVPTLLAAQSSAPGRPAADRLWVTAIELLPGHNEVSQGWKEETTAQYPAAAFIQGEPVLLQLNTTRAEGRALRPVGVKLCPSVNG